MHHRKISLFIVQILILSSYSFAQPAWIDQSTTGFTLGKFWSLSFKDANTGWVVGEYKRIYKTSDGGYTWTSQVSGSPGEYFSGVSFVGDNGWACGSTGMMYHTSDGGLSWGPQASGTTNALYDIYMASTTSGIAVGASKTIIYTTDGLTWNSATVPGTNSSLKGVFMIVTDAYACGDGGRIYKSTDTGVTWNQITTGFTTNLEGIHFTSSTVGYMSGESGIVYRTVDGANFNPLNTGAGAFLYACAFINQNTGWAIAAGQNIRHTTDGGNTWNLETSPVTQVMRGMEFLNDTTGWACGEAGKIIHYTTAKPQISAPTAHDFGILICPPTTTDTIIIKNRGQAPLTITGIPPLTGPDAAEFSILSPTSFPVTIMGGDSIKCLIKWTPGTVGPKTASMKINSNDATNPVWNIDITAQRNYGIGNLQPPTMDFDMVCVGLTVKKNFTLTFTGNITGTLLDFEWVSGDTMFALTSPSIPSQLDNINPNPIEITFQPTRFGTFSSVYKFVIGPCNKEIFVTLTGIAIQAITKILPATGYDFGNIEVGKLSTKSIIIRGTGNALVHITSIHLNPPLNDFSLVSLPPLPLTLNPGDEKTFQLNFTPSTPSVLNTNLCVVWDTKCADSTCIPITGQGFVVPHIVAPSSNAFSPILCSSAIDDTILIRNTGGGTLDISKAAFNGANASSFSLIAPPVPVSVPPHDSTLFIIRFSDNTGGIKTANLVLTHNDVPNNPTIIALSAQRNVSSFAVQGDSIQAIESCIGAGTARSLKIYNNGSVPITVKGLSVTDNASIFHVSSNTLPVTIQPNQYASFEVNFTPLTTGQISARILIVAEPCSLSSVLTIQGIGIKTTADVSPPALHFGDVKTGAFSEQTIEYTNSGSIASVIDSIFVSLSTPSLQIMTKPTLPYRFELGNKFSVTVRFTPATTGPVSASLCFKTSSPCADTICIPIDGNGTSATISVNRSGMDFILPPCIQTTSCDTVLITNSGTSSIDVTDISIAPSGIPFSLQSTPSFPLVLSSGQIYPLIVCASGLFTGNSSATLTITSNDPKRPKIDIALTGHRDSSSIQISSLNIPFGTLSACDTARTISFTITNTGTVGEIITANPLTEPAFTLVTPFPIILQAGESKNMYVRFDPAQFKSYLDSLVLKSSVCNKEYHIVLNGERIKSIYTSVPNVLDFKKVQIGSTSTIAVRVTNANAFQSHWNSWSFSPAVPGLSLVSPPAQQFDANAYKDFTLSFTPQDTTFYSTQFCLIIDLPCPDTLCVAATGQGVRGSISLSKSQLQFGKLAQCELQHDTIICTNKGSAPITITSSVVAGTGAAAFTVLNPTTSPEAIDAGNSRTYFVDYQPASVPDGLVNATLTITTTDSQRPTIDISLQGERITQLLPNIAALDFGTVSVGTSSTKTITITNNGSSRFCIYKLQLPVNVTSATPLPLCFLPGEQKTISLTFTPSDTGSFSSKATINVDQPCTDSTQFQINAKAIPGGITQASSLSFGNVASCLIVRDTIFIQNNFNLPIQLTGAVLSGIDLNLFTIIQPATFPQTIQPGVPLLMIVEFHPQTGNDGTKRVTCNSDFKVDTTTQKLVTQIDAQATTPTLNLSSITYPITDVGSSNNQTITMTNTNTLPVTISSVTANDPVFTIQSTTPPLPVVLQPGQSMDITVRFTPLIEKDYTAQLTLQSNAPCSLTVNSNLAGHGRAQNILNVGMSITSYHARLDDLITIPVMLDTDVGAANVSSWSGSIGFNRTMLFPKRIITENTLSKNMNVDSSYDHKTGTLTITASGAKLLNGNQPLINVEFLVLLGNDVQTAITISPAFDFTSGNARIVKRTDGLFQLEGYCNAGDRLLEITGTYGLKQNRPNPFNPSTKIEYEIAVDGFASLLVFDAMGREVDQLVNEWKNAGRYEVDFYSRDLPSGIYYYVLRSGIFSDAKKMVIAR